MLVCWDPEDTDPDFLGGSALAWSLRWSSRRRMMYLDADGRDEVLDMSVNPPLVHGIDEKLSGWQLPGLTLTGNSYHGVAVNNCVKEAVEIAAG